jgi:hypothetical protein
VGFSNSLENAMIAKIDDKLRAILLSGAVFALGPPLQMFCEIEHFIRN